MSPSWYIVNLDKRQASYKGKFGEWFLNDIGGSLTDRLQRTLTPPSDPLPNGGNRLKGLQIRKEMTKSDVATYLKDRALDDDDSYEDAYLYCLLKRIRPIPR